MLSSAVIQRIERALHELQYGSIQLVVHDAQVVRIERTERVRLPLSKRTDEQSGLTVTAEAQEINEDQSTDEPEIDHR